VDLRERKELIFPIYLNFLKKENYKGFTFVV